MKDLVIEKGIPLPPRRDGRAVASNMQIGDSILFHTEMGAKACETNLRRLGCQPATRKLKNGWRVWRVA